jgi:hypothetical protein
VGPFAVNADKMLDRHLVCPGGLGFAMGGEALGPDFFFDVSQPQLGDGENGGP